MASDDLKPIVLTGLRANQEFHLGNLIGAILPMVRLQQQLSGKYILNMFVPDLHSFTTDIDFSKFNQQIIDHFRTYAACGLDIDNPDINIYRQSQVPAHSQLTVILNNFTYFGELSRMTQFKDKKDQIKDGNVTVGLFDYPVLMASDILLYSAKYVPVGEDQRQHLELTRDIGLRFNQKFKKEILIVPETWDNQLKFTHLRQGVRIMSLSDPTKKMSKSVADPSGTILLNETPDQAKKKVMAATTDSVGVINYDKETQPGITNLLNILSCLSDQDIEEVKSHWVKKTNYSELKEAVAAAVATTLEKLQSAKIQITEEQIERKLADSEAKMNTVANKTLHEVERAIGLRG